ncbi:unnamed protein product [Laminaria digitata]
MGWKKQKQKQKQQLPKTRDTRRIGCINVENGVEFLLIYATHESVQPVCHMARHWFGTFGGLCNVVPVHIFPPLCVFFALLAFPEPAPRLAEHPTPSTASGGIGRDKVSSHPSYIV